ncbi:hypothetical protein [Arthrobacter sp. UYCo732]|uniref:hypothetical protein n=1 Tax=Arthrobacter sp. UYCo732 TaxID=3156336 RepID=UPI003391EDF1
MTTESAAARPYSVTFDALYLHYTLVLGTSTVRMVDNGLTADEMNELTRPDLRRTLAWINKLVSVVVFLIGVGLIISGGVFFVAEPDYRILTGAGFVLGLAMTAGFFWAHIRGGQIRREIKASFIRLTASGRVDVWSNLDRDLQTDLNRVAAVLRCLQKRGGSADDALAREVVAAVLRQNSNEPTKRQLAIAESTATDPASVKIREKTLAEQAAWRADVANAEYLVQELEKSAKENVK